MSFDAFSIFAPQSLGYACGLDQNGNGRLERTLYETTDAGTFLSQVVFPQKNNGAGGGGVIRASLEATAGLSGGPVWVITDWTSAAVDTSLSIAAEKVLVGVLTGSPQTACEQGKNWAAAMTPTTRSRIISIIQNGTAPGMVQHNFTHYAGGTPECTTFP